MRKEGVQNLYAGLLAKCSEAASKNFVYFYIYDFLNQAAKKYVAFLSFILCRQHHLASAFEFEFEFDMPDPSA